MKLLGMIGGTSWHSTIVYYRLINELAAKEISSEQNPPLLLYSLNVKLMRDQDWEKINNAYFVIAKKLEQAGAQAIIICANTPHRVYDDVQPGIGIPILHIADAIGQEGRKRGFKTLGLLGTKPTMEGDFLQKRLKENFSLKTIVPTPEFIDRVHHYISGELTQGKFTAEAKDFYWDQIQRLHHEGADAVILGCTELPMLLQQKDTTIPLLDTTALHAHMGVDFILEKFKSKKEPL